MIKIYNDMDQRSEEWFKLRAGKPTASQAKRLVTARRMTMSSQLPDYAADLATELFLGKPLEQFGGNEHTLKGTVMEPNARKWFLEHHMGEFDDPKYRPAFVYNDKIEAGCSPDLLLPEFGVEIKCLSTKNHFRSIVNGLNDPTMAAGDHIQQIQMSMLVTGKPAWYVVFFHPACPWYERIERDQRWQIVLSDAIDELVRMRNTQHSRFKDIAKENTWFDGTETQDAETSLTVQSRS